MPGLPTIVVVDDAPEVRFLLETQLRLSGRLEVVGKGEDGHQAIALAAEHRPALMLLDVSMPGLDGLAALPRVLDASPTTRVVMFSGFDGTGLADHTRSLGATDFIEKSAPIDDLVDRLVELAGPGAGAASRRREPTAVPGEASRLDPVLEEHLERFREIFEDAAIGMATITLDGRIVRVNRHLTQLFGEDSDTLIGTAYADLVGDGEGAVRDALARLRAGESAIQLEHSVAGAGRRRFQVTMTAVLDAAQRPLYFFLQVQDVTGQRAAEAELRETERRFRLLVEAVQDYAIFMLGPEGHVESWNPGAQRSKGYTADQIIGRHFRVFYPEDKQRERHPEHELVLARREGRYEEEGWRVRSDGSRFWAHVTITAVHDDDGELIGFAKVTRDFTERRRMVEMQEEAAVALAAANRSLELANEQLQRTADDQAKFLAVTAHELRSPVGVLAASADTLARHHQQLTADERTEFADGMGRNASQLRRLLNDLLTASRAQARTLDLQRTRVVLDDLLRTLVAAAERSHPGQQVVLKADRGLVVQADPGRVSQMVDNLLANALRHGRAPVTVAAYSDGERAVVTVRDSGEGVPAAVLPHLFERFGASTGGTGLGLYIVSELARAHGGDISYRREDRTFVLRIPHERP